MPSDKTVFNPNPAISKNAYISSMDQYHKLHKLSLENPEEFWAEVAKQFHWEDPPIANKFFSYNFDVRKGPISVKWMDGATTNICYNLLDRNIRNGKADNIAFYW